MIFLNGASNPKTVTFEGTSLDNVYFNNTLVWNKDNGEIVNPGSGTTPIYNPNGSDAGYASEVPEDAMPGGQVAPQTLGTVTMRVASNRYMYFNDLEKQLDLIYQQKSSDGSLTAYGEGAVYKGLVSFEFVFNTSSYDSIYNNQFIVYDSGAKYGAGFVTWSGLPSNMKLMDLGRSIIPDQISLTCRAKLSSGGTVGRSYTGDVIISNSNNIFWFRGNANGDEASVASAVSGYLMQTGVTLYLMFK